jgi:single-strand DNA-binding protein
MNITVLRGTLSRPPERRVLPSGDELVEYQLTIAASDDLSAESVPVIWPDAPARAEDYEPETELVIIGRTRRRFFKAGGVTQSRTEVVAAHVVPARQAKRAARLVLEACQSLEEVFA